MRQIITAGAALLATLATAAPVGAITGNFVPDHEHPFVGLIVFYDENGDFSHRCSGSLLTPTVFLTAGHCTADMTSARIYFQQDAGANYDPALGYDPFTGYPEFCAPGTLGTLCATSDELYNYGFADFAGFPNTQDVGIVILDQPIMLEEYGALAVPGSLDQLATRRGRQETIFTVSGYGLSRVTPVLVESYRERLMATVHLVNLRSALTGGYNIQLTSSPGRDGGGTCFGDSGGPVFHGDTTSNVIVAVTSFGLNLNCVGVEFAYRTDQVEVLAWIREVVGEDEFSNIELVVLQTSVAYQR